MFKGSICKTGDFVDCGLAQLPPHPIMRLKKKDLLKVALINTFYNNNGSTSQMEKYRLTLKFLSATSFFFHLIAKLIFLLHRPYFNHSGQLFLQKKRKTFEKLTVHYLPNTKLWTEKVSSERVNVYLLKGQDRFSLRKWSRTKRN